MIDSLTELILATLAFVGGHFVLSFRPVRAPLRARLGAGRFQGLYSLIAVAALVWMVLAHGAAPDIKLWDAPTFVRHLPLSLMLVAFIFMVAALIPRNPAFIWARDARLGDGPSGIFRITRHPMMWGVGLWALLHLAAAGDAASLVFFGGLALLALAGPVQIDRRKRAEMGAAWDAYAAATSNLPFAAALAGRTRIQWREIGWFPVIGGAVLYSVVLVLHEQMIGVAPARFLAGIIG